MERRSATRRRRSSRRARSSDAPRPRDDGVKWSRMKWGLLLMLGVAGCGVPLARRLSERGSQFEFMVSAENKSVSFWTLRLDPARFPDREEGVLVPKGPNGTELERIHKRTFPSGSCRAEIRYQDDEINIKTLPTVVDNELFLKGQVSGNRVDGTIQFASEAGVKTVGRFGGFLDRPK